MDTIKRPPFSDDNSQLNQPDKAKAQELHSLMYTSSEGGPQGQCILFLPTSEQKSNLNCECPEFSSCYESENSVSLDADSINILQEKVELQISYYIKC